MENVYSEIMLRIMNSAFAETNPTNPEEITEAIELLDEHTSDMCELCQDHERGLVVSSKFPNGYLYQEIKKWSAAIPWPLANAFPDGAILDEFCALADQIRVGRDSAICLSGTSARTGLVTVIGDIDFCEYVFDDEFELQGTFIQTLLNSTQYIQSVEAKSFISGADSCRVQCPWPKDKVDYTESHTEFFYNIGLFKQKIEFIGHTNSFGYVPVTNIILPSEKGNRKNLFGYDSFSFQEAVIFETQGDNYDVWPLVDIRHSCAYLIFLFHDSQKYAEMRPIKAAKRASALARFLFINDHDREFSELLSSESARCDALTSRCQEIEVMTQKLESACAGADATPMNLRKIREDNARLQEQSSASCVSELQQCSELVRRLLNTIRTHMQRISPELERHISAGSGA